MWDGKKCGKCGRSYTGSYCIGCPGVTIIGRGREYVERNYKTGKMEKVFKWPNWSDDDQTAERPRRSSLEFDDGESIAFKIFDGCGGCLVTIAVFVFIYLIFLLICLIGSCLMDCL